MLITLQFVTEKGWQSAVIRWACWSPYSHVDLLLPDGTLLGSRMDGGVKVRPANYADFTVKDLYQVEGPEAVIDFAKSQTGKPYDFKGIMNFGLHRDWRDDSSWFCSDLIAAAFENAGMPLVSAVSKRVTPRDLTLSPLLRKL